MNTKGPGLFPTHVGMNRITSSVIESGEAVPHARGDEPFGQTAKVYDCSVPHARGDEPVLAPIISAILVCPPRTWG